MSKDDLALNITTPVGLKLRAAYDEDANAFVLRVQGNSDEGVFITETEAHKELHDGNHYAYINAQDVSGSTTISFVIVTPDTPYVPNFEFFVEGESEFGFDFYEDATPDDDGTPVSSPGIINRNRNKPDNNGMNIYSSPTLGGGSKGTIIERYHTGSGKQVGGDSRSSHEVVLKRNTKYWVDVINVSATENFISWIVDWYEKET